MSEPDPTRIVADTDVLVADLLVGGSSREALDLIRAHDWLSLVATTALLDEAMAVIRTLSDSALADDWRDTIANEVTLVTPTVNGHPAVVAAAAGEAATLLSLNPTFQSATAGASIKPHVATSIKAPDAFVTITDPATLHEATVGEPYSGTDRDPRA